MGVPSEAKAGSYYAAFLDLRGRRCAVVGGGTVAHRKAEALIEAGATVTVISPDATVAIRELAAGSSLRWLPQPYRPGQLSEYFLVVGATDDPEVNRAIYAEMESLGRLCNIVDVPELCSFILPAIARRGEVMVAVSTSGASPTLAQRIRDRIDPLLGEEHARLAAMLRSLRTEVRARYPDEEARRTAWGRAVDSPALDLLRQGRDAEARAALLIALGVEVRGTTP